MAFNRLTTDLDIIQALVDEPNDVGGLSAAQLKAKFDEGGNIIKTFLNSTLLAELEATSAGENIGVTVPGLTGVENVKAALIALVTMIQEVTQGSVADGSITTAKLADAAVATAKIIDAAVTAAKLASNAVETAKIVDLAVTAAKLANDAVETAKIKDGAVTADKLASGAVTHEKLGAAAVGTTNIDEYAVTSDKLNAAAVTAAKIRANAVSMTFYATIGTTWTGNSAPYSQAVSVPGLLASDAPFVDVVPSDTFSTAEAQLEAYGSFYKMVAGTDTLTVYSMDATTTAVPVQIKAVRK